MTLDLKLVRRRLFDEQASSHDEQIIETAIGSALSDRHTAMPGIIDSFDPKKQTATVRPALKQAYLPDAQIGDPKWMEINLLVDVPIVFPTTANYALTFPVAKGDECLVIFSERPIDVWQTKGGVQEFDDMRSHDYSDAIAIIGLRSQPNVLTAFNTEAVELRSRDGQTTIMVEANAINIQVGSTSVRVTNGMVMIDGGSFSTANGASGTFESKTDQVVTVQGGIVTGID